MFGHSLEEISLEHNYAIIRAWIYSFHMPAFVFISGYFSKCVRRGRTACIYIASAFSVKILYKFIDYIWNTDFLLSHIEIGILWSLCVTIITIFTFGSEKFSDIYLNVNKKLGDVLVKSGE